MRPRGPSITPLLQTTAQVNCLPVWAIDGTRPEKSTLKTGEKMPTYHEVVESITDYRRADRLIKNRLVANLYSQGPPKQKLMSTRSVGKQFPYKSQQFKYPTHGMNVGSAIYNTTNMAYGKLLPSQFQMPKEFHPCDNNFTKAFNGGNYKFNGLNTAKTFSRVHQMLDEY